MKRSLSALFQALADWLDPARADIRKALRDADTMQAIQREAWANVGDPVAYGREMDKLFGRSMGDEVNKMLAERDAEIQQELAEARGKRPTRFARKLRAVK